MMGRLKGQNWEKMKIQMKKPYVGHESRAQEIDKDKELRILSAKLK